MDYLNIAKLSKEFDAFDDEQSTAGGKCDINEQRLMQMKIWLAMAQQISMVSAHLQEIIAAIRKENGAGR